MIFLLEVLALIFAYDNETPKQCFFIRIFVKIRMRICIRDEWLDIYIYFDGIDLKII